MAYSVTIYIAAAGTPLNKTNGDPLTYTVTVVGPDGNPITTEVRATSTAGHMYYSLNDTAAGTTNYYGFQSTNEFLYSSPGQVVKNDGIVYSTTEYQESFDLSLEQYNKLQDSSQRAYNLNTFEDYNILNQILC